MPLVLCMVAYVLDAELRHVQTIRRWRGEFGSAPPFDIGPDTLFVGYSAVGGDDVLFTVGLAFPAHIYDLHTAFLSVTISYCHTIPTRCAGSRANDCPMLAAATASPAGRTSTRKRLPKRSARAAGASTVEAVVYAVLRRGRRANHAIVARPACRLRAIRPDRPASGRALERVQRQERRANPGARHADRHAAVESACRRTRPRSSPR